MSPALSRVLVAVGLVAPLVVIAFLLTRKPPPPADAKMIVYLEDGLAPARAEKIADALDHFPGATSVRIVGAAEAWRRMKSNLGARADLLDGSEASLLQTTIEVSLRPKVAGMLRAHPLYQRLLHTPGVDDVDLVP